MQLVVVMEQTIRIFTTVFQTPSLCQHVSDIQEFVRFW